MLNVVIFLCSWLPRHNGGEIRILRKWGPNEKRNRPEIKGIITTNAKRRFSVIFGYFEFQKILLGLSGTVAVFHDYKDDPVHLLTLRLLQGSEAQIQYCKIQAHR